MSDMVLRRRVRRLFHALVIGGAAIAGGEACKSDDDPGAPIDGQKGEQDAGPTDDPDAPKDDQKGEQDAGPAASDENVSAEDGGPKQTDAGTPDAGKGSQFW